MALKRISKVDIQDGDVLLDLRESAKATKTQTEALKISLELIDEALKQIKKEAQGLKTGLFKINPSDAKNQKDLNETVKKSTQLIKENQAVEKTRLTVVKQISMEQLKQNEIQRQAVANAKQVVKAQLAEKNSIEGLRAKLALVTNAWTKLSQAELENTKRGQRLVASKKALTDQIGALERKTNDHRRNVGNYGSALDGLKNKFSGITNVAGQFGLALGGVALIRGAIKTISEFETAVADLSAVTGQEGKDLDFLKEKAIDFSKKYGESAANIATAFKLAGSARPELLKNGAAMADLTEKAIILSKASGDDVPTSIANLTGTLNAFELPASAAGKVMDILANASKEGAQEIPYLTEAFTKFGGVAANAGIDIAESAAAVEILGLKIPEASIAGNNLKNVMLTLQKVAADQNRPFQGLTKELEMMKPKMNDVNFMMETFGRENILAAQTLISSTDELKRFTGALDKNGTAQEQASIKSKTLAEAGARLKANIEGYVLEMLNGVDASKGLAGALDFLATNFESIVYWIGKGIQAFVTYKATMMAINMKDRIMDFIKFKDAAKNSAGALTEGESGAKKFGAALKGIGFAVLITALIEVGTELWNIASGADDAARAVDGMNESMAEGSKFASARLQALQDEVGLRTKSKEQYKDQIIAEIRLMNAEKARKKEQIKALENSKKYQDALATNPLFRTGSDLRVIAQMKSMKESVYSVNAELTAFNRELTDMNIEEVQATENTKENTKSTKQSTKEIKEKTKAVEAYKVQLIELDEVIRDLFDVDKVEKQLALEDERAIIVSNIAVLEAEIALKKAEQSGSTKEIEKAEKSLLEAKIKAIKEQLRVDLKTELNPVKRKELELKAELDILNLNKEKVNDIEKEKFNNVKKWGDLTNQYLQRLLDERIEKLDAEIEASKKYQDSIQAQADAGIGNAQQSMAKEAQIQAEAQAKKEKLEKRKAQFAATAAFLNTYLSEREAGKTAVEAFASASLDKVTIEGLINALPTFLEGSDRTQNIGGGVDGKGGFHAILHPDEMVFTKEEREAMGGLTREQVIAKVNQSEIKSFGNRSTSGWENVGVLSELNGLKTELQQVKQAIIDKPVNNIELGKITQKTMEIVHSIKAGNRTTQSTYIVK